MRRSYAGGAVRTTLVSPITTSSPNAVLTSSAGWPDTSTGPCAAVIDRGTADEEKVLISDRSGANITFSVRGYDGTVAKSHSASATIEHIATATDHDEANEHIESTSGVHGLASGDRVVGRSATETLTNKTISGPLADFTALRRAGFEVATRDGTETLQNKTLVSPVLTGTAQAAQVNASGMNIGGVPVVTTTGAQELHNKSSVDHVLKGTTTVDGSLAGGNLTPDAVSIAGDAVVTENAGQTLTNKALDTTSTYEGSRIARRLFAPAWSLVESATSVVGAGDSLLVTSVSVSGATGVVCEAMFSWPVTTLTGAGYAIVTIMANGIVKQQARIAGTGNEGGVVRTVFAGNTPDPMTVSVYLDAPPFSTAQLSGYSFGPMVLTVRPMNL